jgi:Type IX secretion system protein PorV
LKKIFVYILFIIINANFFVYGQQFNKAGRTALQFLKIGIGARPAALGEAIVSNTNDINSIFWNPAAITNMENLEASFTYTEWIADLNIVSGAAGYNLDGVGAIAISYISLDYGQIPEALVTSASGNVDTRTGQNFSGSDVELGIGFARKFTDRLAIGVNIKYLQETLFNYSENLFAFDVGSYYVTGWHGVRLAMSAQNLGRPARFLFTKEEVQQNYDLPIIFRIGWSVDLMGGDDLFLGGNETQKLSFNMDGVHSNDYSERVQMGMEYTAFNIISFRGGYRFNYDEGNLCLGVGLKYTADPVTFTFDYAYVSYNYLQSPHRFTINMAF